MYSTRVPQPTEAKARIEKRTEILERTDTEDMIVTFLLGADSPRPRSPGARCVPLDGA
jgi:hypothetical protein